MALEPITRQEQIISGKDLQPITRMEKFLKEYGGGGSGGGAQSDWNQNDPTKPDYVKNRTHWTDDPVENVLFDGMVVPDGAIDIELKVGYEYRCILDGVEYVSTAKEFNGRIVVGSASMIDGDPAENDPPFYLLNYDGICEFYTPESGEHTLKVSSIVQEVHKIPSKYLPDSVPIVDISGKVFYGTFDFISAGQGLYFSSTSIDFRFLAWDENYENHDEQRTNCSGLFIVSYTPDNGWRVFSVNAMALFSQFGETPIVEGSYDECLRVSLNPAQPM